MRRELLEPGPSALISTALLKDINLPYELMRRHTPVHEPTDNKQY
jgi:hypothetical protein